jgi:hypothetical protein
VEDLGAAHQGSGLGLHGGDHGGVAVAEVGGALAAHTVDVAAAIGVEEARALAPYDRQRALRVKP